MPTSRKKVGDLLYFSIEALQKVGVRDKKVGVKRELCISVPFETCLFSQTWYFIITNISDSV